MDLFLKDRVAIVTGGASGIGRKTCHTFAQEGTKTVIMDIQKERGEKVAKECQEIGAESIFIHADCRLEADCKRVVAETIAKFGKVDILVHDAAPYTDGSAVMPFLKQTQQMWDDFVNCILWGAIYLTREVLPHMTQAKYGRIVYIGSDSRSGDAFQPVYGACKAALGSFAKSMSLSVGRKGITANMINPALTMTEENEGMLNTAYKAGTEEGMAKLTKAYATGKLANAQDLANMIVYMCSDRCSDVAGQVIGVNGGYYMPSP